MVVLNLFKFNRNIKNISSGEIIYKRNDFGDEMYIVREGRVEIRLGEHVVEVVEEGGILGENVMVNQPKHAATAIATTDCQLVIVKEEQFRYMVQETPYFAEWVLDILVGRLLKMNHMLYPGKFSSSFKKIS